MMYIMITSRCNMTCKHCGFACTAKGEDMSIETFRNALGCNEHITLGGGEPTLHPLFWQMLGESIACCESVWLATNGSQTTIAIALAKMAKKGVIGCALSQDDYHDEIDYEVIEAFRRGKRSVKHEDRDYREIRDVTGKEIKSGRWKKGKKGCICEDIIIKPNGDVFGCGCKDAIRLGNVNTGYEIPEDWEYNTCSHHQSVSVGG